METNLIVEEITLELLNTIASDTPSPPTFIIEPDSCSGEHKDGRAHGGDRVGLWAH